MAINRSTRKTVGIVGIPPLAVIAKIEAEGYTVYDLDEPIVQKDIECASPFLPRVYCAILRTVIVNSLTLAPEEIYIDVGPGKCDCAMHTATILADILPSSKIIRTAATWRRRRGSRSPAAPCRTWHG